METQTTCLKEQRVPSTMMLCGSIGMRQNGSCNGFASYLFPGERDGKKSLLVTRWLLEMQKLC